MSIFALIRKGRQQAKDSKKQPPKPEVQPVKVPYRHIPTHAAIDAVAGAPAACRAEDRPRIVAENRRRSLMMMAEAACGGQRPSSSIVYSDGDANSALDTPRSYSFVASSFQGSREAILFATGTGYSTPPLAGARSIKGKEIEKVLMEIRSRPQGPLYGGRTPSSSGNSTFSFQDGLEMKLSGRGPRDPGSSSHSDMSRSSSTNRGQYLHPTRPFRTSNTTASPVPSTSSPRSGLSSRRPVPAISSSSSSVCSIEPSLSAIDKKTGPNPMGLSQTAPPAPMKPASRVDPTLPSILEPTADGDENRRLVATENLAETNGSRKSEKAGCEVQASGLGGADVKRSPASPANSWRVLRRLPLSFIHRQRSSPTGATMA